MDCSQSLFKRSDAAPPELTEASTKRQRLDASSQNCLRVVKEGEPSTS